MDEVTLKPPTVCQHPSHGDNLVGANYLVRVRNAAGEVVQRRGCVQHSNPCDFVNESGESVVPERMAEKPTLTERLLGRSGAEDGPDGPDGTDDEEAGALHD